MRWQSRRLATLLALWCCGAAPGLAQPSLNLPPFWSPIERIEHLTLPQATTRTQWQGSQYFSARTNVHPLLEKKPQNRVAPNSGGYYYASTVTELRVRWRGWRVGYALAIADLYEGNQGATTLYLASFDPTNLPQQPLLAEAKLNRCHINRWSVEHTIPLAKDTGEIRWAVSLYEVRRIQMGSLIGEWRDEAFTGKLELRTTRGLTSSEIRRWGWTMHLAGVLYLSPRWRIGFWGENLLGWLPNQRLQYIRANVSVNTIVPDSEGFLRAPPLLEGRVDQVSEDISLRQRLTFGAAYQQGEQTWLVFASPNKDEPFSVGYASSRYWILLVLPLGEWRATYRSGQWSLTTGLSTLALSRTKAFTTEVRWTLNTRQ